MDQDAHLLPNDDLAGLHWNPCFLLVGRIAPVFVLSSPGRRNSRFVARSGPLTSPHHNASWRSGSPPRTNGDGGGSTG